MRSYLFTPGGNERMLSKVRESAADAVILDLEDAIAPERKAAARAMTAEFLSDFESSAGTPRLYVRINDLESGLADDDLSAIVPAEPFGIMLPKAKSGADVDTLSAKLEALEKQHGIAAGSMAVFVLAAETPEALLNISSFQECDRRVSGYTWGGEDLAMALGARSNRDSSGRYSEPIALARNLCLVAAAAAGVPAIDTVYTDFRNLDGLERDAKEAARDGFAGKAAIHPDQVAIINAAFTPDAEEITRARRIVQAFKDNPGAGAVGLDGSMVDRPHLVIAERTLERARLASRT